MDRTLIAWNVPNMVTIPLMAFIGFLIVAVSWQLIQRAMPSGGGSSANGSY